MRAYKSDKAKVKYKIPRRVGTLFFLSYSPSKSQKLQRLSWKRRFKKSARQEAKLQIKNQLNDSNNQSS